jgi:heme exporter protein C
MILEKDTMTPNTKTPALLIPIDILAALSTLAALLLVVFYAPTELEMGLVQKVFYFHVASAWTGMLGFCIATLAAIGYLRSGKIKWDVVGVASIEIGMVFMLLSIISGSIWAKPIWNTWWTWDPRLTTALIVELIYAAYFLLRNGLDGQNRRAKFAAVYAIIGFVSVPMTFFSIRILRTIHPVLVGSADPSAGGVFAMSDPMITTFFFGLAAFSILFTALFWHRYRLGTKQMTLVEYQMQSEGGEEE